MAAGLGLIALGLVGFSDVFSFVGWVPEEVSPWWHAVPLVVGGVAMLIKRRRPLVALGIGTAALAADFAIGGSISILLVWWDLLYAVGLFAGRRARYSVTMILILGTLVLSIVSAERTRDLTMFLLTGFQVGAVALVPVWWASGVRQGHELAAASDLRARLEAERAEALARIAEFDRVEAVRVERSAMARDLHDVISSHLSAIAIHSGAALAAPPDVDRDRSALNQVRTASLASLDEMRTMIDLLRSDDHSEGLATREGLSSLPALVQWARDAGLEVAYEHAQAIDPPLSIAVDQSALRIIQEALTNALKHGAGSANLAVGVHDGTLCITVSNPLPATPVLAHGGGAGLISMRERAQAFAGTVEFSERSGEWVVRASLPVGRGSHR